MTRHQNIWMFITSVILLTGFKKNPEQQNFLSDKSTDAYNTINILTEQVKVSIADATAIKAEKGQRPVKVMIYLSKATTEPVTVEYSTKDGSAKAGVDYVATKGSVTFQPGEAAKWITVQIIGQIAADPDEESANNVPDFMVNITHAVGATIDMARAFIKILHNIPANPVAGNQAVYEVIISFTGYTSFGGTPDVCGIRPDGVVVLSGYLTGSENVRWDDDIMYTGNLEMMIDMDICSAHRLPNGEDELCGIRVSGSGTVFTELTLYFGTDTLNRFDGRGGYIKIENKDGKFRRVVTGSCTDGQLDEEWVIVPNGSISSVFNGYELPMLTSRTLRKGTYTQTDDGNVTVVQVLRKIR